MKNLMIALIWATCLSMTAFASGNDFPHHPEYPTGEKIGTIEITLSVEGGKDLIVDTDVITVDGGIDYLIQESSIRLVSNCASGLNIPTPMLFDMIAQAVVARGVALGYTQCNTSCTGTVAARVYSAACVQKIGTGCGTRFATCDASGYARRDYRVCCPYGPSSPDITKVNVYTTGCSISGCQSTTN